MTDVPDPPKWWEGLEPDIVALARKLCPVATPSDQMVLPYPAPLLRGPHGDVTTVHVYDLAPLWTCYVNEAHRALEITRLHLAGHSPPAQPPTLDRRTPPDAAWRVDTGLDDDDSE